jgi:hypothetical protein
MTLPIQDTARLRQLSDAQNPKGTSMGSKTAVSLISTVILIAACGRHQEILKSVPSPDGQTVAIVVSDVGDSRLKLRSKS